MKEFNLDAMNVTEMTEVEKKQTEGGFIFAFIGALIFGYLLERLVAE
jgi:hypothetical protein